MGLFTGIGDFFRGAFGESEEEKRRRKEREAQAAAQRQAVQQQPKPQPQPQKPTDLDALLGRPKNPTVTYVQKLQQENKPVTPPPAPKPQPLTTQDYDFKALTTTGQENKKILGWNAAAILPKNYEKVDKVAVDRNMTTNKDKYVAAFDRLDEGRKKILVQQSQELAKKGDQAAINTLQALEETNRIKKGSLPEDKLQTAADYASVPGRSVMRVGTGIAQGVSGIYDLFTPGKGTSRTSKFLDEAAKNQDISAQEAGVNKAYKITNVPVEIASYFIPSTLAGEIASRFPKGTKLTEKIVDTIAKGVDDAGDAGKVRRFLADRMRSGWTLDQAVEQALQSAKYTGENASKGRKTTPASVATDVATAVGGSIIFPARRPNRITKSELDNFGERSVEDLFGGSLAATGEAADRKLASEAASKAAGKTDDLLRQAEDAVDEKGLRNITDDQLRALADDETNTAFNRKLARDEMARRAEGEAKAAFAADPLNKPAFQHKQDVENVIRGEEDKLNRFLNDHPDLSTQQVEQATEAARQRTEKLIQDLNDSRYAATKAVEQQATKVDETVKAGQEAVTEAQATRAAESNPSPSTVVQDTPVTGSPEVSANDAYRPSTEEVLYGDAPSFEERNGLSVGQKLSADRVIRENVTQPLWERLVTRPIRAMQRSDSRIGRGVGRFFSGGGRNAGLLAEDITAKMHLRGGIEMGKVNREAIADLAKGVADDSRERIWASLDPEFAARLGKQVDNLTPEEQVIQQKLKTIIDNTTAENLRRGLITPEQAANDSYIKRAYSVYDGMPEGDKFERSFRQELMNQYKGRKQVSDAMVEKAITDPTYLVGKKTAESEAMWAMQDYGNYLAKSGSVVEDARPGYTQLPDSPVFGEAAGKYVPRNVAEDFTGFQYNNAMVSAFNDLITAYDRMGIRQFKKELLTIFNPAVRIGNQATNRGIFANLSGINPVQFNVVYANVGKMISENHQLYREAVEQGLTGIDITQADFYAQRIAQTAGQDKNMAKRAVEWLQKSYSGADDKARITAYVINRQRGYAPEEAARLTQHGFQDYKSVGFFYDLAAKTPVIGNAFVRFAADSVRIAKNAAIDHPLRTMATLALWNSFTKAMSVASGETPEQKAQREGRFGAPKVPFTDISLAVQTPWGEVNIARFAPWYSLNEISDTEVAKFLPLQSSPVTLKDGKIQLNPKGMNDPLLGQVVQLGIDKDFRGKSIQDPTINPDRPDQFREDQLSSTEKRNNALRFLFNNNMPLGHELDQTFAAARGKEDIYGKDRSLPQAILRDFGIKIEQYGAKEREKATSMKQYQDELAQLNSELKDLSPSDQEAYKRISGYYKLREQVDNEFSPGDKRYKKAAVYDFSEDKWKDFAAHPALYDLMVRKKQREKGQDGKPIQPEFDERLSEPFRKQLIQNKMVAPGDDAELDQRMYSSPEWDYYQQLRKQYADEAKKYYPQSGNDEQFVDELVKHQDAKFPDKPDVLKKYGAMYAAYTQGKSAKPEFTDAVKAAKEQYNKATFDWTNKERKARGLPAIVWDMWNNPTFGYDETPSGFGFGFGSGNKYVNALGDLSNFTRTVERAKPAEAQGMPDLSRFFVGLTAGSGGGRTKPKLGASARGQ